MVARMDLLSVNWIDGQPVRGAGPAFHALSPIDGAALEPAIACAGPEQVEAALAAAAAAQDVWRKCGGPERARLLEAIADGLIAAGDALIERCHQETGLPLERLAGERGRTVGQLRLFAEVAREGSWVDARIETAMPDRQPLPRPDLRRMLRPLGPVVVFGASNFPLAFSVAGGDTASALAAGCPVIVKAHRSHPGTSALVGKIVSEAVAACGLPGGVFSLLHGDGRDVGMTLVRDPRVSAVGFTGSRAAGRALFDAANQREHPIPVFAEMSSLNPLVMLPGALAAGTAKLATGLRGSITLGVGQFCTKPGLVFGVASPAWDEFRAALATEMETVPPATMLNAGICQAYGNGVAAMEKSTAVRVTARSKVATGNGHTLGIPVLAETTAAEFAANPSLAEEVFGPFALVVTASSFDELLAALTTLEGQLTATLHAAESDANETRVLADLFETKAGRVVWNGFPTGVEVAHSMTHGGPYPATTDARFTSVGTAALLRFARPVTWQNTPEDFLPTELQDTNPAGIWRLVNGQHTQSPIS